MNKLIAGIVAAIVGLFGLFTGTQLGGVAPGTDASVASSSARAISATTSYMLFATSSPYCSSRIITTQQDAINLTFSDLPGLVPSNAVGHVQAASTTVAYEATVYGCGTMRVYSYGAQTLKLTETR